MGELTWNDPRISSNTYARKTPGSICRYKLCQGLPHFFTSVGCPMHGTSCPTKSQLKSTCLTAKFAASRPRPTELTGKKTQNVISSSVQHLISLIFAIHLSYTVSFILLMMHILLTKLMQKSVTTVCLHS